MSHTTLFLNKSIGSNVLFFALLDRLCIVLFMVVFFIRWCTIYFSLDFMEVMELVK